MTTLSSSNPDAATVVYRTETFQFTHPSDAQVIEFKRGSRQPSWRLINTSANAGAEFTFDLLPNTSAEEAARKAFENASPLFQDEDAKPYPVQTAGGMGWRCKYRFVDGARAPYVFDTVYFEAADKTVVQIRYTARPEAYPAGKPVFDNVIQSFKFS